MLNTSYIGVYSTNSIARGGEETMKRMVILTISLLLIHEACHALDPAVADRDELEKRVADKYQDD